MRAVVVESKCGCWWCVMLDGRPHARFAYRVDANLYCMCCIESGHIESATLASGLVI